MIIREAKPTDINPMHTVRVSVKENALSNPDLISEHDYEEFITRRGKGWVCEDNGQVVGFAIADLKENNIWALFIAPEFENKGIGKQLHNTMLDWYFSQTSNTLWLGTAPNTRAESFYKRMGWKEVGTHGKGEIKFEITLEDWMKNK